MSDIVDAFIVGIVVVILGLTGLMVFDALASTQTMQTSAGREVLHNAASSIALLVVLGLPGGLLIVALLSGLGR